jgi:GNAT superfamily N-acetyltransferase
VIRRAVPEDAPRLREVARAAKAHWGYDEELVRSWAAGIEPKGEIELAEEEGEVVAWSAIVRGDQGTYVLEDLWVVPRWMGRGIGAELFRRAADRARGHGASALEWGSDPNAVGFYEKVGGRVVGEHLSEWNRMTPLMRLDL